MAYLAQILLLLAAAITVVVFFQRLHIPTSLGYLLVGVVLGPHTIGPVVSMPELEKLAEFGVVFLLFTIGLDFSLPQMQALRRRVLGLGTGQVVFTTVMVGIVLWLAGFEVAAAFVFGAAFAQSSTTVIASLLAELREEDSRHGRLGLAMSVFQDVTAVPFLVAIPALGMSAAANSLAETLGLALAKAALAFAVVLFGGRWLLRPLFRLVAERRSVEVFTLAVLLVALLAAWVTNELGLSLAFGGFLAGLTLGETEFRHQVESSIGPFRDVLLGVFFVGIGMRFDPAAVAAIWQWAALGALLIVTSKTLIVSIIMRKVEADPRVRWRTGMMLSVGGEFGLALIAVALDSRVIDLQLGQLAITSVLLSMIVGAVLIWFNQPISARLAGTARTGGDAGAQLKAAPEQQVVIGGSGRVGRTIATLLHSCGISFVAFDTDPKRVTQGRLDRHPVWLGDIADPRLMSSIHLGRASLVVIAVDDPDTAFAAMSYIERTCPQVPVVARARDLETSTRLLAAGAAQAYPETIESSLRLGTAALQMLDVAEQRIDEVVRGIRDWGYRPVLEKEKRDD